MLTAEKDRIAHLLRRFGFGATVRELKDYGGLKESQVLDKLLNFEDEPSSNPFCFSHPQGDQTEADLGTYRFRLWWVGQMIASKTPLRERLAIFWHDHFAVSDAKVEDGVMMLDYMKTMREKPADKFSNILKRSVTSAAFLKYLDVKMLTKKTPNENFAREVMELYTLGIGNYTEEDIKEASRALTGWTWINATYEIPGNQTDRMKLMAENDQFFVAFAVMPSLHDDFEKKILGKKLKVDGTGLLEFLADQPATARFISKKLWEHFVYEDPEPKVIEKMIGAWRKSDGSIKAVLKAMTETDEFWSEKAQTSRVKSPFDMVASITRALGVHDFLREDLDPSQPYGTKVNQKTYDDLGGITYHLDRMGMSLLYPEDVSGWKWGKGWLSPSIMVQRSQYRGVRGFSEVKKGEWQPDKGLIPLINYMKEMKDADETAFTNHFLTFFDARLSEESAAALKEFFVKRNYKGLFAQDAWVGWTMVEAIGIMSGTPGFQTS